MRTVANIILTVLVIPSFLIGLIAATLKFQLLEPKFWQASFKKNNVYNQLSDVIKKAVINSVIKEGGKSGDIKSITDLITTENITDFVDKNLGNVLNYANGRAVQLLVYIPVGRTPRGFLPKNFENLPETMPLSSLLTKLNIIGVSTTQIQYISLLGRISVYLLTLDIAFWGLFLVLLFLLTKPGKRFIWPALSFIFSGLAALGLYLAGSQLGKQTRDLVQNTDNAQVILGTVAPPILTEAMKTWLFAGIFALIIGILLLFLRKGSGNLAKA